MDVDVAVHARIVDHLLISTRSRIVAFGLAGLLVVAGGICAALVTGTLGQILGFVLISVGLVSATSLVFLEVGLSEDRERQREELRARRRAEARLRHKLGRMRGRPRRLD